MSAPWSPRPPACSRPFPADNLNKLIGELATSLSGQAGNLRTLISAGTTFSKEFVAYQQQFTELLANAPPSLDAITAVAPELRQDVANTAALVQVLAQQKTGFHTLAHVGIVGVQRRGQPADLAVGQPRLLPPRQRRHPVQRRRSPPTSPTCRRGWPTTRTSSVRSTTSPCQGVAKPTTSECGGDSNQTFLRTRLLFPPVLDEQAQSYSSASTIPNTLPGAGCVTAFGNGVGPATQPGFTPAAGGHVVAPSAQEADVEVASATPVGQVASAAYHVPANRLGDAAGARWTRRPGPVPGLGRPPLAPADAAEGLTDVPGRRSGEPGECDTRRENGET